MIDEYNQKIYFCKSLGMREKKNKYRINKPLKNADHLVSLPVIDIFDK